MFLHCDPDKQPAGDVCNSNGMWPFRLNVQLHDCGSSQAAAGGGGGPVVAASCTLDLDVFRAWNPADVPPVEKPFNYRLDFNVTVYLTAMGAAAGNASSSFAATPLSSVTAKSTIHDGLVQVEEWAQGRAGYAGALVGLPGFGFELLETDGLKKLGRYMERLVFSAEVLDYEPSTGKTAVQWRMGFNAPLTVFPCKVAYWLDTVLLHFD